MRSSTAAAATAVRGLDLLTFSASRTHSLNENSGWNHLDTLGNVSAFVTKSAQQDDDGSVQHSEWRAFPLASYVDVDDDGG
jgi:hypothetical protein